MTIIIEEKLSAYSQAIATVETLEALQKWQVQLLGKQGEITQLLKQVVQKSPEERPAFGQLINKAKQQLQSIIENQKNKLMEKISTETVNAQAVDITLPGRGLTLGALHPLTQTRYKIEALFKQMSFQMMVGPEIEEDSLNFSALNIPEDHPARTLHDTFYLQDKPNLLLRTHTSTVQIHTLKHNAPPLRIISTGPVYRCDSDVTHTPMFHQLEGMVLDEKANFSELKGLLSYFLRSFFEEPNLIIRFRASYFPFTEPSAEVDIQCILCANKGCATCHYTGWLEILGCGMVHPNVLRYTNINPEKYQGYAFGMGIDRLTLLRYRIPDLRMLFENNIHFIKQFR